MLDALSRRFRPSHVIAPLLGLLGLALVGAACGGKVVYIEDGDGSGGSGAAGGAGPGPGPGPGPSQTSTTTTGPGDTCTQFCAVWGACSEGGNCVAECQQLFGDDCDAEANAFLVCLTQNFNGTCEIDGDTCSFELNQYAACTSTGPGCVTDFCDGGGPGGCYCQGTCFGQDLLEQQCFGPMPGGPGGGPPPPPLCDCFFNGEYIGSCDSPGFECSIEGGCCQNLLFVDG